MPRWRRLAISLARSTLKPSMPPESFGIACGAKVASTPVLSGGSWASAAPAAAAKRAAAKTVRFMFRPYPARSIECARSVAGRSIARRVDKWRGPAQGCAALALDYRPYHPAGLFAADHQDFAQGGLQRMVVHPAVHPAGQYHLPVGVRLRRLAEPAAAGLKRRPRDITASGRRVRGLRARRRAPRPPWRRALPRSDEARRRRRRW